MRCYTPVRTLRDELQQTLLLFILQITCVRDSEGQPQFKKGLISNYSTGEVTGSCIGTNSKVTIESLPGNFPTDLTCKVVDTSGDDFYAPMNMLYTYGEITKSKVIIGLVSVQACSLYHL